MAALAHASALLNLFSGAGGLIAALVIWLTQKEKSAWVAFHALQALVFQAVVMHHHGTGGGDGVDCGLHRQFRDHRHWHHRGRPGDDPGLLRGIHHDRGGSRLFAVWCLSNLPGPGVPLQMDRRLGAAAFHRSLIDQKYVQFFWPVDSDRECQFDIGRPAGTGDDDCRGGSTNFRPAQCIRQCGHEIAPHAEWQCEYLAEERQLSE